MFTSPFNRFLGDFTGFLQVVKGDLRKVKSFQVKLITPEALELEGWVKPTEENPERGERSIFLVYENGDIIKVQGVSGIWSEFGKSAGETIRNRRRAQESNRIPLDPAIKHILLVRMWGDPSDQKEKEATYDLVAYKPPKKGTIEKMALAAIQ